MLIKAEHISHCFGQHQVLDDVSLEIRPGEVVGLLGESGSGKSTLGCILTGLLKPEKGELTYKDQKIARPFQGEARKKIQVLFQHPEVAFNPKMTLERSLKEIYDLYKIPYTKENVRTLLMPFGICEDYLKRYPDQLSGGELQRIALARILLVEPEFIVLDEPTSMLDVISQAHIVRMLMDIRKQKNISYLFITHDEQLCEYVSDRIVRIEKGKLWMGKETQK